MCIRDRDARVIPKVLEDAIKEGVTEERIVQQGQTEIFNNNPNKLRVQELEVVGVRGWAFSLNPGETLVQYKPAAAKPDSGLKKSDGTEYSDDELGLADNAESVNGDTVFNMLSNEYGAVGTVVDSFQERKRSKKPDFDKPLLLKNLIPIYGQLLTDAEGFMFDVKKTVQNADKSFDPIIKYLDTKIKQVNKFSDEIKRIQTFPEDFNFLKTDPCYVMGMSVPPFMTQRVALEIYNHWFKTENN